MGKDPLNQDINYLQGQIHGLQALVLCMAGLLLEKETFLAEGQRRIEAMRDVLVAMPVQETTLAGIDEVSTWLSSVTS